MIIRMQQRRDTSANWSLANPTLAAGEIGYDEDADNIKMGNGTDAWDDLDFLFDQSAIATSYNVHDYGAVGDGVADDTAAIQAAIDACFTAGGGTVSIAHKTQSKYKITGLITVKTNVDLMGDNYGDSSAASQFLCASATAAIRFGNWAQGAGHTGGTSGNFFINGNGTGDPQGLMKVQAVRRTFIGIRVRNGAGNNIYIDAAQNCTFMSVDSDTAGAAAAVLDNGAGGNLWMRSSIGSSHVALNLTDDPAVSNAYAYGPSHNTWLHCIFENYQTVPAETIIKIECGGNNRFSDCGISASFTGASLTSGRQVIMDNLLFPSIATFAEFDSCNFNGGVDVAQHYSALELRGSNRVIFRGTTFIQFSTDAFVAAGTGYLQWSGICVTGNGITNLTNTTGGGSTFYWRNDMQLPIDFNASATFGDIFKSRRLGDNVGGFRFRINRDGQLAWSDGTGGTVKASVGFSNTDPSVIVGGGLRVVNRFLRTTTSIALAADGAVSMDTSLSSVFTISLAANATSMAFTNPIDNSEVSVRLTQDATGGRTYVWPTNARFDRGTAPQDTTPGSITTVTFRYSASTALWNEISRSVGVGATQPVHVWTNATVTGVGTNPSGAGAPIGYMKDQGGRVFLRGLAASVSTGATVLFTLPAKHRPAYTQFFPVTSFTGTPTLTVAYVQITAAGAVSVPTGGGALVSFDSVNFMAEQ